MKTVSKGCSKKSFLSRYPIRNLKISGNRNLSFPVCGIIFLLQTCVLAKKRSHEARKKIFFASETNTFHISCVVSKKMISERKDYGQIGLRIDVANYLTLIVPEL
jgi:hypothetical protein